MGFPGGSDCNESACNVGDQGLISGLGISLGEGNGNPLQYSCLENPMDRAAWQATVHGITKNWSQLKWLSTDACMLCTHKQLYQMTVFRYWGIEGLLAHWSKICTDALFVLLNSFSKEIFTGRRQRICLPMQVPLEPVNWVLLSGVSNPGLQTHK